LEIAQLRWAVKDVVLMGRLAYRHGSMSSIDPIGKIDRTTPGSDPNLGVGSPMCPVTQPQSGLRPSVDMAFT